MNDAIVYYKVVNTLLLIINFMMCLTLRHYYKRLETMTNHEK